jgi:hypothetical protein
MEVEALMGQRSGMHDGQRPDHKGCMTQCDKLSVK